MIKENYEKQFRQGVRNLLKKNEQIGNFVNQCCCEYTGAEHGKFVSELINILVDEVKCNFT